MPNENRDRGGNHITGVDPEGSPTAINAIEFVKAAIQSGDVHSLGVPVTITINILQLVPHPEAVQLFITQAVRSTTLEFDIAEEDKGKVIGRGGHTIDALRSLAKSISGNSAREYDVRLIESVPPRKQRPTRRVDNFKKTPRFERNPYSY